VALALLWELTSPEVWTSAVSSCNCKRQKEDQTLFILCPKSFLFGRGFRPHPCLPLIAQFLSLPEQLQFSGEGVYLVNFSSADEAEEAEEADTCPQKRPRKPNSPPDCIYILYTGRHMYFDKIKVKYTHNLNLLLVNYRHQWKGNFNAV